MTEMLAKQHISPSSTMIGGANNAQTTSNAAAISKVRYSSLNAKPGALKTQRDPPTADLGLKGRRVLSPTQDLLTVATDNLKAVKRGLIYTGSGPAGQNRASA